MAEVISEFPKTTKSKKYPWNQWCDGQVWRLKQGADFQGSSLRMRSHVYATASNRGLKARTQSDGDDLIIQFYKPEHGSNPKEAP